MASRLSQRFVDVGEDFPRVDGATVDGDSDRLANRLGDGRLLPRVVNNHSVSLWPKCDWSDECFATHFLVVGPVRIDYQSSGRFGQPLHHGSVSAYTVASRLFDWRVDLVMAEAIKTVTIYTDGACIGNPGPGGYGVVLIYGTHRKELSGGFRLTTNNRMEIMAAIVALNVLKTRCSVAVYTDSQYVSEAISKGWAKRWRANGWRRNDKVRAKNADLWTKLLDLCSLHEVAFVWVRGHAGDRENERCDQLSVFAAEAPNLSIDVGYEEEQVPSLPLFDGRIG